VRIHNATDLGNVVRERRGELGWTQARLATEVGVSRRWLSDLEAGKSTAAFSLILRTLGTLGLIVDLQPEKKPGGLDLDRYLARFGADL
jgi:HTH-type transcriptional regulator / antitoxin HipB